MKLSSDGCWARQAARIDKVQSQRQRVLEVGELRSERKDADELHHVVQLEFVVCVVRLQTSYSDKIHTHTKKKKKKQN
jgi:hypothetical protein